MFIFNIWTNIVNSIYIPDNQKLLIILDKLSDIFAEQRKRRIGHHDVRFIQQLHALFAPEISISIKLLDVSSFMVAIVYKLYSATVFPVSSRYQLLKAKLVEINLKIPDEVGFPRVVAVAVYYFVLEMLFIMS